MSAADNDADGAHHPQDHTRTATASRTLCTPAAATARAHASATPPRHAARTPPTASIENAQRKRGIAPRARHAAVGPTAPDKPTRELERPPPEYAAIAVARGGRVERSSKEAARGGRRGAGPQGCPPRCLEMKSSVRCAQSHSGECKGECRTVYPGPDPLWRRDSRTAPLSSSRVQHALMKGLPTHRAVMQLGGAVAQGTHVRREA